MNRIKNVIIFSLSLLICIIMLTGCSKKYTVEYIVDGQIYQTEEVKKGKTVSNIDIPNKKNHQSLGWYDGEKLFDFSTEIKQDYKLTAKYELICNINGHVWANRICTDPKVCTVCGHSEASNEQHIYENICDTTCDICGDVRECIDTHNFLAATHDAPETCDICGQTRGEKVPYANSVESDISELTIYMNENYTFSCNVLPSNAPQEVEYSVRALGDAEATIDKDTGVFTAIKPGTVYVTIRSKDVLSVSKIITVTILHPLLEEDIYDAYNIMTGLGADASTQIEINYHTHNVLSFVEYTLATDTSFSDYSTIIGNGYYFSEGSDNTTVKFDPRNVYRVTISDLEPNTQYIYRINKGNDTYSDVYTFKTAPNDGGSTSFFVLSDTHYHAKQNENGEYVSHGSEISEEIFKQALLLDPNISFIATAGDMVDTGGNSATWDVFFEHSQSLKSYPRIGVAGNHEYYVKETTQSDGKYQKAHYATPYNGPKEYLGLSGYYVYNNILFMIVDNEKTLARSETLKWMENVLASHMDVEYTFVMMHTPVYYERQETSNQDRDEEFLAIFEKYSVDLVLAGHYHSDRIRTNYYQGADSNDPGLGVNYMSLSFSGVKSASESNPATGYIFNTNNGVITITRITADGTIVSTRTITSKRNQEKVEASKEELISAVNDIYDETTGTYTINLSNKFYGNVQYVTLTETNRNTVNKEVYFPTPSYNKIVLKLGSEIKKFYDHHFILSIKFNDGTVETLEFDLDLSTDQNPTVSNITSNSAMINFTPADMSLDWTILDYVIYVNGVEYSTVEYLQYDMPITNYLISNLSANTEYEVEFVARNYQKGKMFSFVVEFKTAE